MGIKKNLAEFSRCSKLERTFVLVGEMMKKSTKQQNGARQEILEAALRLFSAKGYFCTSMQDVRREAGVSIGAIYHYFRNKEEIATALYDSLLEQMSARTGHYLDTAETFAEACQALIRYLFAMAEEAPHALQFLLYARHREFLPDKSPICTARPFELLIEAALSVLSCSGWMALWSCRSAVFLMRPGSAPGGRCGLITAGNRAHETLFF